MVYISIILAAMLSAHSIILDSTLALCIATLLIQLLSCSVVVWCCPLVIETTSLVCRLDISVDICSHADKHTICLNPLTPTVAMLVQL